MAKIKGNKTRTSKTKKGTLDQKHIEKIAKFEKMTNSIPLKKKKLKKFINRKLYRFA